MASPTGPSDNTHARTRTRTHTHTHTHTHARTHTHTHTHTARRSGGSVGRSQPGPAGGAGPHRGRRRQRRPHAGCVRARPRPSPSQARRHDPLRVRHAVTTPLRVRTRRGPHFPCRNAPAPPLRPPRQPKPQLHACVRARTLCVCVCVCVGSAQTARPRSPARRARGTAWPARVLCFRGRDGTPAHAREHSLTHLNTRTRPRTRALARAHTHCTHARIISKL